MGPAWADSAHQTAFDQVNETYGPQIVAAEATDDDGADDLALAAELLAAAGDENEDTAVRFALADTAVVVAGRTGTAEGVSLARQAIVLAGAVGRYEGVTDYRRAMQVLQWRLGYLERHRPGEEARHMARGVCLAQLAFVEAAIAKQIDLDEAGEVLDAASQVTRRYDFEELAADIRPIREQLRIVQRGGQRVEALEVELAEAVAQGDHAKAEAIRVDLAELAIAMGGNIPRAAEVLQQTDDPRAEPLAAAALFLDGGQPDPTALVTAAEILTRSADEIDKLNGYVLRGHALEMARYAAEGIDEPAGAGRARALVARLEQLMGVLPSDGVAEQLAAYDLSAADLAALPGGRLRVRYDFSRGEQAQEWGPTKGHWQWQDEAMTCIGGEEDDSAAVVLPLRFRVDQPLRLTFRARGPRQIGCALDFCPWDADRTPGYQASITPMLGGRLKDIGGARLSVFGKTFAHTEDRITPSQWHDVTFELDGGGGYAWSVDGRVIYVGRPIGSAERMGGSLAIRLFTSSAGSASPTAFDDVVIEGALLPTPDWAPED